MLKNYLKIKIDEYGNKRYLNDEEQLHRLDGPAVEYSCGTKYWAINGNYHRNIDLAEEYSDGEKLWRFKGERHRVGGSFYSHSKWWFIHGEVYSKEDYFNKVWDI